MYHGGAPVMHGYAPNPTSPSDGAPDINGMPPTDNQYYGAPARPPPVDWQPPPSFPQPSLSGKPSVRGLPSSPYPAARMPRPLPPTPGAQLPPPPPPPPPPPNQGPPFYPPDAYGNPQWDGGPPRQPYGPPPPRGPVYNPYDQPGPSRLPEVQPLHPRRPSGTVSYRQPPGPPPGHPPGPPPGHPHGHPPGPPPGPPPGHHAHTRPDHPHARTDYPYPTNGDATYPQVRPQHSNSQMRRAEGGGLSRTSSALAAFTTTDIPPSAIGSSSGPVRIKRLTVQGLNTPAGSPISAGSADKRQAAQPAPWQNELPDVTVSGPSRESTYPDWDGDTTPPNWDHDRTPRGSMAMSNGVTRGLPSPPALSIPEDEPLTLPPSDAHTPGDRTPSLRRPHPNSPPLSNQAESSPPYERSFSSLDTKQQSSLLRSPSDQSTVSSLAVAPLARVQSGERISLASAGSTASFEFIPTPTATTSSISRNVSSGSRSYPDSTTPAHYDLQRTLSGSSTAPDPATSPDPMYGEDDDYFYDEDQDDFAMVKNPKGLELHGAGDEDDFEEDEDEERFVNLALLSHVAVRLRDNVPRGTHVKGSIPYQKAFTGKDIVTTLQNMIQRYLLSEMYVATNDRTQGLMVARSLHHQLFFYEVEWGGRPIADSVEDVFSFLDDFDSAGAAGPLEREELPTGVITAFTRCYSPSCWGPEPCYAYACPRRNQHAHLQVTLPPTASTSSLAEEPKEGRENWRDNISREFLQSLSESEVKRQDIIHKIIKKEEQFNEDLDILESLFLKPLRTTRPALLPSDRLEGFIEEVFGNFLELRECSRRLLDVLKVRQREQYPVIQKIGDVFLNSAVDFRQVYPAYVGHLPVAEKRLKDETDKNPELRLFLEQCSRSPAARRRELKHFMARPSEHLKLYPVTLQALLQETMVGGPEGDYLLEALRAIRRLHSVAQLMTFQSAMLRGPTANQEWHNFLPEGTFQDIPKKEVKRQSSIFELIKGEMEYVKDLEIFGTLFIRRLKSEPVIPKERLSEFIHDVFYNWHDLFNHHRHMLDRLQEIQRDDFPTVHSITEPIFDAALNWRDAYMEYIPHYPIAVYKYEREMETNPAFQTFVESCSRAPDARKLDLKAFINRPIPRILRYELLLSAIYDETPPDHSDRESIPQVLEVIRALSKATQPGVASSTAKVELWKYSNNLIWKEGGETVDLQLLDDTRSLIHSGKLLRQPDTGFEWNGWSELFVLLFDNYLVMTKVKEMKDGVVRYIVNRRPIPLELLALTNFTEIPQQRSVGLLRGRIKSAGAGANDTSTTAPSNVAALQESADPRFVYPFTIHHTGRLGGLYTLYAESDKARSEWKAKLDEALGLRAAVQENNKVLEIETLSVDTFYIPSSPQTQAAWNEENSFTGRVTCSVPFSTPDGRGLIAVGCAEGVWIGLRHDSRSLRRVLALKQVTQCAMLEKFGIFLVLADKGLYAYLLEALVPTASSAGHAARQPEKLNKDVVFFSVGMLGDRTLITYMRRKGMDSVFQVVEPVMEKIMEKAKPSGTFGRFMSGAKSEWFRNYREFFLPSDAYDVYFLRLKIVILCAKGFEIMGLADFKSDTIPHRDDPKWGPVAKRFESCKPIGIFRTTSEEFLLCYDEFGIYVGRHGDPSRGEQGVVEWEGRPTRAAFHPPYVLLFDSRFIEIRHIAKLHLVQIIPGTDIRCIYDGRASDMTPGIDPGTDGYAEGATPQDSRVHAVMKSATPTTAYQRGVAQHVFELVPTIPLYLPEPLSSPSASGYFNQDSPPHSPQLRATSLGGWR